MSVYTLSVRAVRERTFATPVGVFTVQLMRPREYRTYGWPVVEWAVLVTNPDRTRVVVARGEEAMPRVVALTTADAMLRVLPDAWRHRVGGWNGKDGFDRLHPLGTWATYRRNARTAARSATPGYWGEQTATRAVRSARVAWAKTLGWEFPDGYVEGYHLFPGKSTNRD